MKPNVWVLVVSPRNASPDMIGSYFCAIHCQWIFPTEGEKKTLMCMSGDVCLVWNVLNDRRCRIHVYM